MLEISAKRFWSKVKIAGPDECWEWQAYRNHDGYGRFSIGRRDEGAVSAHRLSWELTFGKIPDDLCVLHKCDNPPCVNPKHLFLGTHQDNMRDRDDKNKLPTGNEHWSRKNPEKVKRGESNNRSKLTTGDVLYIRWLHKLGKTNVHIAKLHNISPRLVGYIIHRDIWKHI